MTRCKYWKHEIRSEKIGIVLGAGDFQGKILRESRAKHLMVLMLPDSSREFDGTFLPSEAAGLDA